MLCFILVTLWIATYFEIRISLFRVEYNLNRLGFRINLIRSIFIITVAMVRTLVKYFSTYYIQGTKQIRDFKFWLNGFILSILLLLIRNSWWVLILGWEILGITSFYLVAFYGSYTAHNGAIITVITNRLGDLTLITSLLYFLLWGNRFTELNCLLIILIFISAITKRAQIPFSAWLPIAIRAPTPVSSLVHSSTLVTAGLFLLIKFGWAYIININISYLWGLLTLLLGGRAALLDSDVKKVVAFSTLRQLGFLLLLFSSGSLLVVIFHLVAHAFFKRILFITVGMLIHNSFSNQRKRLFRSNLILNYSHLSFFSLTLINLSALSFILGSYSKESAIRRLVVEIRSWQLIMLIIALSLTAAYSLRLLFIVRSYKSIAPITQHSGPWFITFMTLVRVFLLTCLGYFWSLNLVNSGAIDSILIIIFTGIAFISYWILSIVNGSLFYSLAGLLQQTIAQTRKLKWWDLNWQLYWIPIYPLSWLNRKSWLFLLIFLILFLW